MLIVCPEFILMEIGHILNTWLPDVPRECSVWLIGKRGHIHFLVYSTLQPLRPQPTVVYAPFSVDDDLCIELKLSDRVLIVQWSRMVSYASFSLENSACGSGRTLEDPHKGKQGMVVWFLRRYRRVLFPVHSLWYLFSLEVRSLSHTLYPPWDCPTMHSPLWWAVPFKPWDKVNTRFLRLLLVRCLVTAISKEALRVYIQGSLGASGPGTAHPRSDVSHRYGTGRGDRTSASNWHLKRVRYIPNIPLMLK